MKAKIHKIELYIVDLNNRFDDADELIDFLEYNTEDTFYHKKKGDAVEFEWDDDLSINKIDAKTEDYEKYFKL